MCRYIITRELLQYFLLDHSVSEVGSIWGLCVWNVRQCRRHLHPNPLTILSEKSIHRTGRSALTHYYKEIIQSSCLTQVHGDILIVMFWHAYTHMLYCMYIINTHKLTYTIARELTFFPAHKMVIAVLLLRMKKIKHFLSNQITSFKPQELGDPINKADVHECNQGRIYC